MSATAAPFDLAPTRKREQSPWSAGIHAAAGVTLSFIAERRRQDIVDRRSRVRVQEFVAGGAAIHAATVRFGEEARIDGERFVDEGVGG